MDSWWTMVGHWHLNRVKRLFGEHVARLVREERTKRRSEERRRED